MQVLYFHGFASSPASGKITALRPLLEPHGIELDTPDMNVPSFEKLDWEAVVAHGVDAARRHPPCALVGSSLGALIALSVAARGVDVPLVLIAPAVGVVHRWKEKFPGDKDPLVVFNYARNADAPIHRAFFKQIDAVRVDERPPASRVTVIMGRHDESVPFDMVRARWEEWEAAGLAAGSRFIEIAEGDHGLVNEAELIASEIVRAVADRGDFGVR